MILITAHGRLAHQPELKLLPGGGCVCEFRLLSTRFAKNEEHVEAVTFFCFDDEAERFCEATEKGQLISASGTQETRTWTDGNGQSKSFVRYRLTWYEKGPRPNRGTRAAQGIVPAPAGKRSARTPGTEARKHPGGTVGPTGETGNCLI
jgi:single-stranded DNA-binding protein